jgi:uncharacterized protein YdaL
LTKLIADNNASGLNPFGFSLPHFTGGNDGNKGRGFGNASPLARPTCVMFSSASVA